MAGSCRSVFVRGSRGARVFFTVALAERGGDLLLREIEALPAGDSDYSVRWGADQGAAYARRS